jgi:hypothetical protein
MSEASRVLKPGVHVLLVDFIFTDECAEDLRKFDVQTGECVMDSFRSGFLRS